jgi:hypothetical protein
MKRPHRIRLDNAAPSSWAVGLPPFRPTTEQRGAGIRIRIDNTDVGTVANRDTADRLLERAKSRRRP